MSELEMDHQNNVDVCRNLVTNNCCNGHYREPLKNSINRNGVDQWVKLNVGGVVFCTTKTTLAKDPNSFLCRLVKDDCDLSSHRVSSID